MPRGGHNAKPALAVVREGNPGHRPVKDAVVLPPSDPVEPAWNELLIGRDRETAYARKVARELWQRAAPTLTLSVGLVSEQQETLIDYCLTWARIVQQERALSREGALVAGAQGALVRNPRTTILNQLRSNFRAQRSALGLSPVDATRLSRPTVVSTDDEDDPFD